MSWLISFAKKGDKMSIASDNRLRVMDSIDEFIRNDPRVSEVTTSSDTEGNKYSFIVKLGEVLHRIDIVVLGQYETVRVDHKSPTIRFEGSSYDLRTFQLKKLIAYLEKDGLLVMPLIMKKG
jgi:hypothetical protein